MLHGKAVMIHPAETSSEKKYPPSVFSRFMLHGWWWVSRKLTRDTAGRIPGCVHQAAPDNVRGGVIPAAPRGRKVPPPRIRGKLPTVQVVVYRRRPPSFLLLLLPPSCCLVAARCCCWCLAGAWVRCTVVLAPLAHHHTSTDSSREAAAPQQRARGQGGGRRRRSPPLLLPPRPPPARAAGGSSSSAPPPASRPCRRALELGLRRRVAPGALAELLHVHVPVLLRKRRAA